MGLSRPKATGRAIRQSKEHQAKLRAVAEHYKIPVEEVGARAARFRVYGQKPDGTPIVVRGAQGNHIPTEQDLSKRAYRIKKFNKKHPQ